MKRPAVKMRGRIAAWLQCPMGASRLNPTYGANFQGLPTDPNVAASVLEQRISSKLPHDVRGLDLRGLKVTPCEDGRFNVKILAPGNYFEGLIDPFGSAGDQQEVQVLEAAPAGPDVEDLINHLDELRSVALDAPDFGDDYRDRLESHLQQQR